MGRLKKAKMVLPKMTTRRVWIGAYFNHYNAVVIFSGRPFYTDEQHNHIDGKWIDLIDSRNKPLLAGCTSLEEFKELFPSIDVSPLLNEHGNSKTLEPQYIIEIELTAIWDGDRLKNIDFSLDGYQI